jgi:hypothetical protein
VAIFTQCTNMKAKTNLSHVLSPRELQWFGQWLSESQMWEGIAEATKFQPNPSHWLIFNVLKTARRRAEKGLPLYGKLQESPSEEKIRGAIKEHKWRMSQHTRGGMP